MKKEPKQNAKKKLNLTGTLPKNLLSPTNQGYKHKHSDYFESTNHLVFPVTAKSGLTSKTAS